jgi:hypothetical protein
MRLKQMTRFEPGHARITARRLSKQTDAPNAHFRRVQMKKGLFAAALVALSASFAAPVFASGYGPSPAYQPAAGAPASQRGPNSETLRADNNTVDTNAMKDAVGGMRDSSSQAGARAQFGTIHTIYAHH